MIYLSIKQFDAYFKSAFEGALLVSKEGKVIACNNTATTLLEIPKESLLESPLLSLLGIKKLEPGLHTYSDKLLNLRIINIEEEVLVLFEDRNTINTLQKELQSTYIALDTLSRAGSEFILSKKLASLNNIFAELLTGIEAVCGAEEGALSALPIGSSVFIGSENLIPLLNKVVEGKVPINENNTLGIPLISSGIVIGALALKRKDSPFSQEHIQVILPMVQMAILFLEGGKLAEEKDNARKDALAASRAKSAFLANMSHEIRTPLNSVMGMTELLLNSDLTDTQENLAQKTYSAAEILLSLINDILDISKVESGKLKLESIPFSIDKIIGEVVDLIAPAAEEKKLHLNTSIAEGIPSLNGDPTRLRQVLTNLVGNAVKFTSEGSVTISANFENSTLSLVVKDTGIGIKEERQKQIFDLFTQEDASTTRKFGGTGLGLAISKQLTEAMGGTLHLESTQGKGTKFTIELHYD